MEIWKAIDTSRPQQTILHTVTTMQAQNPDFSSLVQDLLATKAKSDTLISESKELIAKAGRVRRSLEKLGDAMSEENYVKSVEKAISRRKKSVN